MSAPHPLDNPIWEALGASLARFAESAGPARRFVPDVSLLAGFNGPFQAAFDSFASLVGAGESVGLFLKEPTPAAKGWTISYETPLLQMLHRGGAVSGRATDFLELGAADVPEMIALARLTKPGPFSERTRELGDYVGLRERGKLIAMSGERLRVPGFTEISAVCTHPDFLGRGYARALMAVIAQRILDRGEVPFLHVRADNGRAAEFYERFGFSKRVLFHYAIFRRDA